MNMKISQRQARYYRKRTQDLEGVLARQKQRWATEWSPGWINIESIRLPDASFARIDTARKLGHAVIAVPRDNNEILFYAEKL
jgi:hypothetical protein